MGRVGVWVGPWAARYLDSRSSAKPTLFSFSGAPIVFFCGLKQRRPSPREMFHLIGNAAHLCRSSAPIFRVIKSRRELGHQTA